MTIKQVQHLLAYLGYCAGAVDGIWGPLSEGAARAFQRRAGLTEDGVPGPQTQEALIQAVCSGFSRESSEEPWWPEIDHFRPQEFACKCGQYHSPYCDGFPARPKEKLVRLCEAVRVHFGVPVRIISGLRCSRHNADSGGVANSQHMYGEAADICVTGVDPGEVEAFLDTLGGVRYHYTIPGSRNVHFDIPKEV